MKIYCCQCEKEISARFTTGAEIYPHRPDLYGLPFWRCDACKNYVGCHHKTANRTQPLGNIPSAPLRNARNHIHRLIDPLWKTKKMRRGVLYTKLSSALGYEYHTGEIKTIEEARRVYTEAKKIAASIKKV